MRYVIPSTHHEFQWQEDVERIVAIFEQRGHEIDYAAAQYAWETYSESVCAGWLILPDLDSDIFNTVSFYLEAIE